MRSGRGQRSRWCGLAALALSAGACASSTAEPSDASAPGPGPRSTQQPGVAGAADEPVAGPTLPPATSDPTVSSTVEPIATDPTGSPPTTVEPVLAPAVTDPTLPPTTAVPTTTLPPDCIGLDDQTSGTRAYVDANGQQRTYELAVPRLYDGTRATPLIVNFHAYAGSGSQHDKNTLMGKEGTLRGYIVVSPDSTSNPPSWNQHREPHRADDFSFVHGLVAQLQATMCIDGGRIYAAGHSNGGTFAAFLACSSPYEFVAVAVVAAVPRASCPAQAQPALIQILGTEDDITLYYGSATRPSALESIQSWAAHAGCVAPPVTVAIQDGVEAMRFDGCAGADVVLMSVIGGDHPWPGGPVAKNRAGNSPSGRMFPATRTILDFFDDHIRRG
jgi:polyhydroxybutyrate depolymerase